MKLTAPRLFRPLFGGTIRPFQPPEPVEITLDDETRFTGHWIIAPSGSGKTVLLHNLFLEDLTRPASIIVMDSKGELIEPIKNMQWIKDRLVLVEPDAHFPLALNPFDIPHMDVPNTIALLEYIISGLMGAKFTELQLSLFRNVIPAIIQAIENPTIFSFRDVIAKGIPQNRLHKLDSFRRTFFEDRETGFYSTTYTETKKQVIWRLDDVLSNDLLRAMFSAPRTKFDISALMDEGRVIVINNNFTKLTEMGVEVFSRFFIYLILSAAMQRQNRPHSDKLPCFVYIDECHFVIRNDPNITNIIDQCRSQNIGLILSHQRLDQIKSQDVLSALKHCGIKMANSDMEDARTLAPLFHADAAFLANRRRGEFAFWSRKQRVPTAMSVPYIRIQDLPTMTYEERRDLRDSMLQFSWVPEPPRQQPPSASPPPPPSPSPPQPTPKPKQQTKPPKKRRGGSTKPY